MSTRANPPARGPLQGIRILDTTTVQMGPYSTVILADLGADVIKVEMPKGGDTSRHGAPFRNPGMSQNFMHSNRNKRSVALDLKHAAGRAALLRIAATCDVFLFNLRPEAMARLRLTYEDFVAVNPKIIYVNGTGFSHRGPYGGRPAYDDILQGMSGLSSLMGQAHGTAPEYSPTACVDRMSALHIVIAILAAINHCRSTGEGQRVEVPMFENFVHTIMGEHMEGETFIPAGGGMGHLRTLSPDHRPFPTKDGHLCTHIHSDEHWKSFFRMTGLPNLIDTDERFASRTSRIRFTDEINRFIVEQLAARTTAEWVPLFIEHDLPVGAVNTLEDVLDDPHLNAIGYFRTMAHPTEGTMRYMTYATEFSKTPVSNRRPAPRLGEHTESVLEEAGLDRGEIDNLIAQGAAGK